MIMLYDPIYIERLGTASPPHTQPEELLRREGFDVIIGSIGSPGSENTAENAGTAHSMRAGACGSASYATVICGALRDGSTARRCSRAVAGIISDLAPSQPRRILVAGLGNPKITADALGSRTAELVLPRNGGAALFTVTTGVPSGLTSAEVVAMFATRLSADLIVAVDALAAISPERLVSIIQVSDGGIPPGSGVASGTRSIDEKSMGCPVITVGVPTVIRSDYFTGERRNCRDATAGGDTDGGAELYAPVTIDREVELFAAALAGGINLFAAGAFPP